MTPVRLYAGWTQATVEAFVQVLWSWALLLSVRRSAVHRQTYALVTTDRYRARHTQPKPRQEGARKENHGYC